VGRNDLTHLDWMGLNKYMQQAIGNIDLIVAPFLHGKLITNPYSNHPTDRAAQ